jgi:hypothetical protein
LASVSTKLREELKSGTVEGEDRAFTSYFAEFIEIERQATAAQLREVSDKIQAVKPRNFPGENLKDLVHHSLHIYSHQALGNKSRGESGPKLQQLRLVCRLKKSLYGLAISPRLWYKHLFEALLKKKKAAL